MSKGKSASAKMAKTGGAQFEGKTVNDLLSEINYSNMEQKLGLQNLSNSQKDSIMSIFHGLKQYDQDNGKPYVIDHMEFEQPYIDHEVLPGMRNPIKYAVSVYIRTSPHSGNSIIDTMDIKSRITMIGRNGGMSTYKNGKRVNNSWEARYGERVYRR